LGMGGTRPLAIDDFMEVVGILRVGRVQLPCSFRRFVVLFPVAP
jgi:hypothetical protein